MLARDMLLFVVALAGVTGPRSTCMTLQTGRMPGPHMQVGMTGGDLEGGSDSARNTEVKKLKQLFYKDGGYERGTTSSAAATANIKPSRQLRDLADLGLLRDLPIARFRFVLMPHQQAFFSRSTMSRSDARCDALVRCIVRCRAIHVLCMRQVAFNIFQPQLVHMFETLLATPPPWLYVHALLPGGADNLGNPEYALPGLGEGEAVCENCRLDGAIAPPGTQGFGPKAALHTLWRCA